MSLSPFEEELLRAGVEDAPSAERRRANRAEVLRAAGLVTSAAAAFAAVKPAAAKASILVKVVAASAVGFALAGGAVLAVPDVKPPSPVARPSDAPTAATASASSEPSSARPIPLDAQDAPSEPSGKAVAVGALPDGPSPLRVAPPAATPPDPLAAEARLLEEARACVRAADHACARAKLLERDAAFPNGALAEEAAFLAFDAARARGDEDGAMRAAERLIARHPSSPHAKRARAWLERRVPR